MVLADWCAGPRLITCEARNLGARVISVLFCSVLFCFDGLRPCINSFCSSGKGGNRERHVVVLDEYHYIRIFFFDILYI